MTNSIHAATVVVGVLLGVAFALIWHFAAKWLGKDEFWQTFARTAQQLISGEDDENFFRHYFLLIGAMLSYVGKLLIAVTLASLPVAITLSLLAPVADSHLATSAQFLEIHSAAAASIQVAGREYYPSDHRITLDFELDQRAELLAAGRRTVVESLLAKHAFCSSRWRQMALRTLGFRVAELKPPAAIGELVIVRPSHGDDNPLWPYLADLEFLMLAVISGASIVSMLMLKRFDR
jgi:hypothetical protein